MNTYEGMFLIDSAIAKDAENWNNVTAHVSDILTKNGAQVIRAEKWGERKLAYEIKGCKRGAFLLIHFTAPGSTIAPIKRDCQLSETILRTLVVIDEDGDAGAAAATTEEARTEAPKDQSEASGEGTGQADERDKGPEADEAEDAAKPPEDAAEEGKEGAAEAGGADEGDGADGG